MTIAQIALFVFVAPDIFVISYVLPTYRFEYSTISTLVEFIILMNIGLPTYGWIVYGILNLFGFFAAVVNHGKPRTTFNSDSAFLSLIIGLVFYFLIGAFN